MLKQFIDKLSQELSMEGLITSNNQHHYFLPFDEEIDVEVMKSEKNYLLKGIIGEAPKNNPEGFFLKIMEANLFGRGTRGGVIGLNEEGLLLILSMEVEEKSSYKDFKEQLEDFVSVIDFWRKEALKHE